MTADRPFRILEVIGSVDPMLGGPIEGVLRQDEATRGDGVLREIVSCDPPDAAFVADFPMTVHAVGQTQPSGRWGAFLNHYGYAPKLVPWLKAHAGDYDAVIVNGLWNYAALGASMGLADGPTPYFVFTHGMMDPWFRRTYPLKHMTKQLFWLFGEGRLLAGARSVLFTTQEERRLARGQFLGWSYRETVVGYGTAPPPAATAAQEAAFRVATPALGARPYLLFLSRIHRKKGCDLLVEAFAKAAAQRSDLDLVIAGPNQEGLVAALQARAHALAIGDRIHWPGMLRGDAKWGAFHGAEAFILPSHQENFGIVVAEALGCGTPVLITDKVNIWREVESGQAGFVETDDIAGVEKLLNRWIMLSVADRQAMSARARSVFMQDFDVNHIGPALVASLKRLSR